MESVNEKMAREYARVKEKKMTLDTNRLQDMMRSGSILPGVALAQDMPNVGRKKLTPPKKFIDYEGGAIDWSKGNIDLMSRIYPSVEITIDTPTQNQEIPSDEDVVVSFTVTTDTQNYIYAIALVVDGVEVEKRTPYSSDDFTIAAGTLTEAAHTIQIRAYDIDDVQVFETGVRSFEVMADYTYLLDEYPTSGVAYSVRKLKSDATLSMRVRRSSDNSELDVGFDSNNNLDTASILAFCGAGDGFVVTWYDQSGNNNNATNSSASAQPKIVSTGVLNQLNGKPIAQNSTGVSLVINVPLDISTSYFSAVLSQSSNNGRFLGSDTQFSDFIDRTRYRANSNIYTFPSNILTASQNLLTWNRVLASSEFYENGALFSSDIITTATFRFGQLFSNSSDASSNVGFQEFVLYNSDQSLNRAEIEKNINNYFNIYSS